MFTVPYAGRLVRPALPLIVLASVALAGCFQITSTLTVRADGSATLRDRVVLTGLAAVFSDEGGVDKGALRRRAAALGEGVRLVGVDEAGDGGHTAVYAVPDVTALRYTLPVPDLGGDGPSAGGEPDLTFAFARGTPATLRIVVPEESEAGGDLLGPSDGDPLESAEEARRALRYSRAFLDDARMEVRVEVEGRVVESDAAFREGPVVTVMEIEFSDLLDVMEESPELMTGAGPSSGEVRALLADRPGVRVQEPGTVTVRFE